MEDPGSGGEPLGLSYIMDSLQWHKVSTSCYRFHGLEVRYTNSYRYTEVEVEVEQLWWQVEVSM